MGIVKQRPVPEETKEKIVRMFLQNPDEEAIAKQYRISVTTVSVITRKYFQNKPAFQYLNK